MNISGGVLAGWKVPFRPPLSPSPHPTVSVAPLRAGLPLSDQRQWFKVEIHPYEPGLRSFLRRHFPTIADVDDLVQEAYARLFKAKAQGEVTNARSFLYTTARNVACDHFRRNRIVAVGDLADIEQRGVLEDKPDAAEILSQAQDLEILREAIQTLPPRCRDIFTLRRLHGLSYKEIGARLAISEHTVNAQLAIGVARCRAFLLARGVMQPKTGSVPVKEAP